MLGTEHIRCRWIVEVVCSLAQPRRIEMSKFTITSLPATTAQNATNDTSVMRVVSLHTPASSPTFRTDVDPTQLAATDSTLAILCVIDQP